MHNQFRMQSHNGRLFKLPDIVLDTVRLPDTTGYPDYPKYESLLFSPTDWRSNEVVAQYHTLDEAVNGHKQLSSKYGLR